MSDQTIRVGDLVMVVRYHHCQPTRGLGVIFRVEKIESAMNYRCFCGTIFCDGRPLAFGRIAQGSGYTPLSWLRKIEPPALTETQDEREGVSA